MEAVPSFLPVHFLEMAISQLPLEAGIQYGPGMRGACVGCPQSTQTLKGMVEKTVRFYVPEVRAVALQDFHDLLLQIF